MNGDNQCVWLRRAVRVELIEDKGIVIVVAVFLVPVFVAVDCMEALVYRTVREEIADGNCIDILQLAGKERTGRVNRIRVTVVNVDGFREICRIQGTVQVLHDVRFFCLGKAVFPEQRGNRIRIEKLPLEIYHGRIQGFRHGIHGNGKVAVGIGNGIVGDLLKKAGHGK